MNREILERLIIDRGLQELPADCSALLDEYLRCQPEAAALAAGLQDTMRRVCSTVRPAQRPRQLPPLRSAALKGLPSVSGKPRWSYGKWFAAAAVVMAFVMGERLGARPAPSARGRASAPIARAVPQPDPCDFWSLARFQGQRGTDNSRQRRPLVWSSPVAWPRPGERL
jgi:hypothetical protein